MLPLALVAISARAGLVVYPEYPEQIERDWAYRVTVAQPGSGTFELPVYNHCEKTPLSDRTYGGDVNRRFCEFAFSGEPVRVDIEVCEDVRCYSVFPASRRLRHGFQDGVISVWLEEPANFGIRLNDLDKTILSVFADAPENPAAIPSRDDPGVLFVDRWTDPPGEDGTIVVAPPLREVYVAPGAVLNARLAIKTENARVHGRGMILDPFSDVFRFNQTNNTRRLVLTTSGKGTVVEDIKIVDARSFNFGSWAEGVVFRNVKALSSMMCSDGITAGGKNLLVDGAWLYVGDNGLVVSGLRDSTYRNVAIGTSCNAIFPQHGNENIVMDGIDVFRADEGLVKNTYNGALRRNVKWDEMTTGGAKREPGPQDLVPQRQSFLFRDLSAVDCVLFARFFVGGNMGTLPKTFVFDNLSIPHSTGESHWRSIGKKDGVAVSIYDDPARWLVTDNYALSITNLWIGGEPAAGFAPETVKNGHLAKIEVVNDGGLETASPLGLRQRDGGLETASPSGPRQRDGGLETASPSGPRQLGVGLQSAVPNRAVVDWICPRKTFIGDALVRDWRCNYGASGELRLPPPPASENLIEDREGTRSDWQRSPSWMVKFEATSSEGSARIYRLVQCEKKSGIANVITEKFLRHGPGGYRLAFDAAATLGAAATGAPVPMTADFVSNEKTVSLAFAIPPDGEWHHVELEADLDFDPSGTGLVALLLRAGMPVDEIKFKQMSLTKDSGNERR